MVYRVALVRHGQSEFNLNKKFTGWTDVDLTETGRKEAIQVSDCCFDHTRACSFGPPLHADVELTITHTFSGRRVTEN